MSSVNFMKFKKGQIPGVGGAVGSTVGAAGQAVSNVGNAGAAALGAAGGFFVKKLGSTFWLVAILALYAMDWFVYFDGIDVGKLLGVLSFADMTILRGTFNALFWILFILYFIFQKPGKEELIALFVALAFTNFILNGLGVSSAPALIHLAFSILFFFFVLIPGTESRPQALYLYSAILFLDFFMFSIIAHIFDNAFITRFMFPFIFFIGLKFTDKGLIKTLCIMFFVFFYVLQVTSTAYASADIMGAVNEGQKMAYKDSLGTAWANFKGIGTGLVTEVKTQVNKTKESLNPTYAAEIDRDSKRELGVSLTLDTTYPRKLSENSTITVYSNVKGRNLIDEENFSGNASCYAINERTPSVKIPGKINDVDNYEFEMNYYDYERSLTCKIDKSLVAKGYYKVYFVTDVISETTSYMTSYFIDKDSYEGIRPVLDENKQTIFQYAGITEQKISKSSAGLAEVGIGTKSSPIVIVDGSMSDNYIGISVNGKNTKLLEVGAIDIVLPSGMSLTNCDDFELDSQSDTGETIYISRPEAFKDLDVKQGFSKRCDLRLDSPEELLYNQFLSKHYYRVSSKYTTQMTRITEDIVVN